MCAYEPRDKLRFFDLQIELSIAAINNRVNFLVRLVTN